MFTSVKFTLSLANQVAAGSND